ncbi:MAG: phage holin family protein [Bacteroidales bacterium]|nr:phage holin family protein [Bacteroidales bacterium]
MNNAMRVISKLIITTLSVFFAAWMLKGISIDKFTTAILVAIVLSVLNIYIKPVLIFLTIPITFFTFGIFLLVINAFIIIITSKLVNGFYVSSFMQAFWFSIIVSVVSSVLEIIDAKFRDV